MKNDNTIVALITGLLVWVATINITAQSISSSIPENPDRSNTYLFYLHGGIVQEQGVNAVSEYYGKYEYLDILDSLSINRFYVISEARPKGTKVKDYALKVKNQIDTLLSLGVSSEKIVLVGASLGAYIAMEAALKLNNLDIRYVIIGLCSDYAKDYFSKYSDDYIGHFFSIYERSDSKGSCREVFTKAPINGFFQEIELNTGLDHGFLYKPYKEWVDPMIDWIRKSH